MLNQDILTSPQPLTVTREVHDRDAHHAPMEHESGSAADGDIFTIGDVSRIYGVSLRALRFYEERQLLQPERRGMARLYDRHSRKRLEVILKGKQLGFTLSEIRDMLEKNESGAQAGELTLAPSQVEEQIVMLERQRADIERAIGELRATQMRLQDAMGTPAIRHAQVA